MINEVAAPMHIGAALNFDLEPVSNTDERFCITPVSALVYGSWCSGYIV